MRARVLLCAALLAGCATFPRRMDYRAHDSLAMNGARMQYAVYAPDARRPLPLVVFLHGGGDGPDALDRHGITARVERAMQRGAIPPAVIVLPDGDLGFWANWVDRTRRYEDWIADELVPLVEAEHGTLPCPEHCHVMGVSMGGNGALRFAHHRPDRFSTVTAISGPVMDTDQMIDFLTDRLLSIFVPVHRIFGEPEPRERIEEDDLFLRWTAPEDTGMRRIVLAWGDRDRGAIVSGSRAFSRHLRERRIPHEAWEYQGGHGWASWAPVIERALAHVLGP